MKNSKEQKILGVTIDNKLTFKSHIKNLCKKASRKKAVLSRLSNHLNDSQERFVLNSIVKSCLIALLFECSVPEQLTI